MQELQIQYDPQLTETGVQQAIQTGQWIKKQISLYNDALIKSQKVPANNVIEVILVSSPFQRTINTALEIAQ